jgi:hypothetical protein
MSEEPAPFADSPREEGDEATDRAFEALFVSRLTPQQRLGRATLAAGAVLLALVMLFGSFSTVRSGAVAPLVAPTPTPTFRPQAENAIFYLDTNLPDMVVSLDGRAVPPSRLEAHYPFQLGHGRHRVTWQAGPFTAQSCVISLPAAPGDTCLKTYGTGARHIFAEPSGDLLLLHASLLTLTEERQQALLSALADSASGLSEMVQPGEPYFTAEHGAVTADRPLRATLRMRLGLGVTRPDTFMPACVFSRTGGEASPCLASVSLRSCAILCILPFSASAGDFLALVPVALAWDYATTDGRPVALGQPIGGDGARVSLHYALFRIVWDGARWHTILLSGPDLGAPIRVTALQVAADPACVAALDLFFGRVGRESPPSGVHFHSGPNPAMGCLITATMRDSQGNDANVELLGRFGILLAVNDAARRREPSFPVAGGAALETAHQLGGYPGQAVDALPLPLLG